MIGFIAAHRRRELCADETNPRRRFLCLQPSQVCRKTVPGLDHHCSWLNTCVGTRNYTAFFALTVCCAAAFATEVATFLALLTSWRPDGAGGGFTAMVAALLVPVCGLAGAFTALLAFHVMLLYQGVSTFAWMLNRREAKRAKARAARSDSATAREAADARRRDAGKARGQELARARWAEEHPGLAAKQRQKQAGAQAAAAAAGPGAVDAAAGGGGGGAGAEPDVTDGAGDLGDGGAKVHPGVFTGAATPPVSPARKLNGEGDMAVTEV